MSDGPSDGYRMKCEYEENIEHLEKAYAKAMENVEFVTLGDAEKAMQILISRQKEILNDIHEKRKKILNSFGVKDGWEMIDLKVAIAQYERKKDIR
jgi:hypothetical protein